MTIRYDADGNLIWKGFLKSPAGTAQGVDVGVDSAGNVYVLSILFLQKSSQGVISDPEFATAKYNPSGVRQWINFVHTPGSDTLPGKIAVSSTGDVHVAGSIGPNGILTIKYDTNGRQLWSSLSPAPPNSNISGGSSLIALDSAENVIETVGLDSNAIPTPHELALILKYDSNGHLLRTFGGPNLARVWALRIASSGNSYIAGDETSGGSALNPVVTKFDPAGNVVWSDHFPENLSQRPFAGIATDRGGNVFVAQTLPNNTFATLGGTDISVMKLDPNGNQKWTSTYNAEADGSAQDIAFALAVNSFGQAYVTGASGFRRDFASNYDFATVKYDADGKQIWVQRFDGPTHGNDQPVAMVIQADGGLVVTGTNDSGRTVSNLNWATINYIQDGAKLAPALLSFGNEALGTQSGSQTVTLTNTAETGLIIRSITVTGDFHLANNCPTTLAAGTSCKLGITFTPTELGGRTGTLSVLDDWEGSEHNPQTVKLSGTGVTP